MQACLTMLLYLIDMTNPKFDSIQRQFRIQGDSMLKPFLKFRIISDFETENLQYECIKIYAPIVYDISKLIDYWKELTLLETRDFNRCSCGVKRTLFRQNGSLCIFERAFELSKCRDDCFFRLS